MVSAESVGILRLFPISLAEDLFDLFLRNNPLYTTPGLTNSALLPVYCLQSRIRMPSAPLIPSFSGFQPLSTWAYSGTWSQDT